MNNENEKDKDHKEESLNSEPGKQSNDFTEKNEQDDQNQNNLEQNIIDDASESDDDFDNLLDFPDFDEIDDFDDIEDGDEPADTLDSVSDEILNENEKQEAIVEPALTREEIAQRMKDLRDSKNKKTKGPLKEKSVSHTSTPDNNPENINKSNIDNTNVTFEANENTPVPNYEEEPAQPIYSKNILLNIETHRIHLPFNSIRRLSDGEKITINGYQKGHVKVTYNNDVIATGQVMQIGDHLGIRIDEVNTTKI
jgi:flagellar motor switch/type III secretory pathway protein FliN